MHVLHLIFGAAGRLAPGCFAAAVVAVYVFGLAAQWLTVPAVLSRVGLWPFLLAQALLTWIWFALHAKRLRDAGGGVAAAQAVAVIHALAVALLVLVGAFFLDGVAASGVSLPGSILLLRQLFEMLRTSVDPLTIFALIACSSLVIVPLFSLWAGTRPSQAAQSA